MPSVRASTMYAMRASLTGHLVLSTLHTMNASQTIERIIDIYPNGDSGSSFILNTIFGHSSSK